MRIKAILVSIFGLSLAGGAVYLVSERTNARTEAQVSDAIAVVELVVARKPIPFGQVVEAHMLTTQNWPANSVPPGTFRSIDEIVGATADERRRTKGSMFEGELILASKLSNPGQKVTIVQKLGENKRAMAIKVNAVTAVGGFVTPGDNVDILMTQGNGRDLRTVTILQNIRVIGVDQKSEEDTDSPEVARTVTVEVTPNQGQRLALAQDAGRLSLSLRTLDAVADEPMQMIDLRDLLQQESPQENIEARPKVVVRRGIDVEEVAVR